MGKKGIAATKERGSERATNNGGSRIEIVN
jgi:hypothetical protein